MGNSAEMFTCYDWRQSWCDHEYEWMGSCIDWSTESADSPLHVS